MIGAALSPLLQLPGRAGLGERWCFLCMAALLPLVRGEVAYVETEMGTEQLCFVSTWRTP
jgi:hypothetical protein